MLDIDSEKMVNVDTSRNVVHFWSILTCRAQGSTQGQNK
jgi:hypothetical protein